MVVRSRQPARLVRRVESCFAAAADLCPTSAGTRPLFLVLPGRRCRLLFKLVGRIADNSFVHKSVMIVGLMLALSAAPLAGIGEWGAEESSNSAAGLPSSSASLAGSASDTASHAAAVKPMELLPPGSYSAATTPGYTVSRTVPEVRLEFTVADEQGRLLRDLSADDIRILDNRVPVEHFNDFAREENLPLRLGIVLDSSDSMKRALPEEKLAALNFLDRILRPQSDRAFVMGFGGEVRIWQAPTSDRAQLMDAVSRLHQPGWGTSFYDALYEACNQHLSHPDVSLVHRVIVAVSDGDDTQSFHALRDVVAIALRAEVQIYTLALHDRKQAPGNYAVLQRLAELTGGRFYVAQSSKDFDGTFAEIEQELRTQYFVSFVPKEPTPGFHALQLQVRVPEKTQVHSRQGYYALPQ